MGYEIKNTIHHTTGAFTTGRPTSQGRFTTSSGGTRPQQTDTDTITLSAESRAALQSNRLTTSNQGVRPEQTDTDRITARRVGSRLTTSNQGTRPEQTDTDRIAARRISNDESKPAKPQSWMPSKPGDVKADEFEMEDDFKFDFKELAKNFGSDDDYEPNFSFIA